MSHNTVSGVSRYPKGLIVGPLAAALAMLCVMGCATRPQKSQREFHDGPMVRPAPAFVTPGYTPAGAGLPEYMPGPPNPVQRGTDARVLPPTTEPGIWASGGPVRDLTPPRLLDVVLPFPPALDDPKEGYFARKCAKEFNDLIDLHRVQQQAARLPPDVRGCIAAKLYHRCVSGFLKKYEAEKAKGDFLAPAFAADLRTYLPIAVTFVNQKCDGSQWPPDGVDLHDGLAVSFMRSQGIPK